MDDIINEKFEEKERELQDLYNMLIKIRERFIDFPLPYDYKREFKKILEIKDDLENIRKQIEIESGNC